MKKNSSISSSGSRGLCRGMTCNTTTFYLTPEFQQLLPVNKNLFDYLLNLNGEIYRQLENRKTLRFSVAGKNYFIKQHRGIGWREISKNLLQGRLPILGAENEWQALQRLMELKVSSMQIVGYGKRGINPATQQSFLITEALENTESLEDFCKDWLTTSPPIQLKKILLTQVANIARTLHNHGMNHRDFYICHFLLDKNLFAVAQIKLYLIDLHRCQIRKHIPKRWLIKDLAGLYFSSLNIGLTQRDICYFLRNYFAESPKFILKKHQSLLKAIEKRAIKLYKKTFGQLPKLHFHD